MKAKYLALTISLCLIPVLFGIGAEPAANTGAAPKADEAMAPKTASVAQDINITQEWSDAPLREVLSFLMEKTKVTIVPDMTIDNSIIVSRLSVNNLNWRDVLNEAVRLSGCILVEIKPNYFHVKKVPLIEMNITEDTPVEKVISQIAALAGVSIIISSDVKGMVKFSFRNVPWMDALEYVCKTTGFTVVKESYDVYRIVRADAISAQLETRIFQLKYLRPPADYRAKIDTTYAVGAAKAPDAKTEFTVLDILQNMLTKSGILKYDAKTNNIIVKDTKPALDDIQKVIEQLDVEPLQIMFKVNFINTTNEDLLKFGMEYAIANDTNQTEGWKITSVPKSTQSGTTQTNDTSRLTNAPFGLGGDRPNTSFSMGFLTSYDITAILRMFAQDVKSRLEQRPFILTLDGREATIWVGERIHFPQVTVTAATGSTTSTTTIEEAESSPAEQGFQLLVVPHVVKGTNKIMLTIIPQNKTLTGRSSTLVSGFESFTITTGGQTNSIDLPRTQQSTLITNLIVESGQTAIIGGLSTNRSSKTVNKIPFLGDIPVIGNLLFSRTDNTDEKSYLLISLTPVILHGSQNSMDIVKEEMKATEKKTDDNRAK
jgi:type IV pilus assembly protein PilQ